MVEFADRMPKEEICGQMTNWGSRGWCESVFRWPPILIPLGFFLSVAFTPDRLSGWIWSL